MKHAAAPKSNRILLIALTLLFGAVALSSVARAQTDFTEPTHEELAMKSLPGFPGVAAVVLRREIITKDDLHVSVDYERIKILTEEGKKYANVELPYVSTNVASYDYIAGDDKSVEDIQGRTIHPDGTIVPFTGKPYLKVMEKGKGFKYQAKIFTLPDVTVGSIIEYRFESRINNMYYEPPTWIIQGDLYVKAAHYMWYPSTSGHTLTNSRWQELRAITWFPILPKGVSVVRTPIPGGDGNHLAYQVTVTDIPPVVKEEYMPPLGNYSYRVYFSFIAETSSKEFWQAEGKDWSKRVNSFVGPDANLKAATEETIAGASTPEHKLRAIYSMVMSFENTDFTRQREAREDKAAGLGNLNNTDDVLKRKRGSSTQLTELFIGMARAAGFTADAMLVPDRSRDLFIPSWLTLSQFDDLIAIVNLDGKDVYFDPGSRYCKFGHLAWQHTFVNGLRQKDKDTEFAETTGDDYEANLVARAADLKMDGSGQITGRIDLSYSGAPGLHWRQEALTGDDESLKHELRTNLEAMIPHSLEVKDVIVVNLADYEQPLKVSYKVEGTLGTATGKRLIVPADIFLANEKATFPHEKRDIAVDFHYPQRVLDAERISFPSTFSVDAAPSNTKFMFLKFGACGTTIQQTPTSFTSRREYVFSDIFVVPEQYAQLRTFYSQMEANDQQMVILKSAAPITRASISPSPAAN